MPTRIIAGVHFSFRAVCEVHNETKAVSYSPLFVVVSFRNIFKDGLTKLRIVNCPSSADFFVVTENPTASVLFLVRSFHIDAVISECTKYHGRLAPGSRSPSFTLFAYALFLLLPLYLHMLSIFNPLLVMLNSVFQIRRGPSAAASY
jgi:hypothetical protein